MAEANKVQKKLSLRTEEQMGVALDYVVQQVADGALTPKQGDVINTSVKQTLKVHDLKLKYLRFFYEAHKKAVDGGTATLDMLTKKMPSFFIDDARKVITAPKD